MLFLKKYLLFVFLIENIMVQTALMGAFANQMFYIFLALGLLCVLDPRIWRMGTINKFGWAYTLMGIYIFYEFFIGSEYINQRSLLYLLAKIVTFVIIISGVLYNEKFYAGTAVKWLIYTMSFFLLYGLASGDLGGYKGRMLVGFTNSNTTGAMGAIIVGMLVFYTRGRKWKKLEILCLLAGMFGVLASGSRAGFLMLGLLVFLRYGINIQTVIISALVIVMGLYVLPSIGIETVGLQRMMDTYEGIEGTNRDIEREAAEWMIAQRPWTGWGFEAINQGYAAQLTELGSHNGYLEVAKQMGIPMAILYFIVIALVIIKGVVQKYKLNIPMNMFLALTLMYLVKANYEALFVGVHEFDTNLFFFALAMVSSYSFDIRYSHDKISY